MAHLEDVESWDGRLIVLEILRAIPDFHECTAKGFA